MQMVLCYDTSFVVLWKAKEPKNNFDKLEANSRELFRK